MNMVSISAVNGEAPALCDGCFNETSPIVLCATHGWLKEIVEESHEVYELMHMDHPNQLRLIINDLQELKERREADHAAI